MREDLLRKVKTRSATVLVRDDYHQRTGLSSGLFVNGSPVSSSYPSTFGLLYDILYTRPEGRWTQRSEIRLKMTSSGTLMFTTKVRGVDCLLSVRERPQFIHFGHRSTRLTSGEHPGVYSDPEYVGSRPISNAASGSENVPTAATRKD